MTQAPLISESASATSIDAQAKALAVNLDPKIYGTFAEIGAGQEIAGWFFKVGGAAGTVAKTMSAYDMTVSDDIYGKASQYVSEARLRAMLNHEYSLLSQRLGEKFGSERTFFVLADTVSARNFKGTNDCHGWVGIRFQENPLEEPMDIVLHINLFDNSNFIQQEALGILGVNLLYGAYFIKDGIGAFLKSLLDDLSNKRIEVDHISFKGGDFSNLSDTDIALELIYSGLSPAVIISKDGKLQQPSAIIRKRSILIERGAYRILNSLGSESIEKAKQLISKETPDGIANEVFINELSIKSVHKEDNIPKAEMKSLVSSVLLNCESYTMISSFTWYYDISKYLRRYSKLPMGFVMGLSTVMKLFDEDLYDESSGSLLEALGRLLAIGAKVYVYPMHLEHIEELQHKKEGSISWTVNSDGLVSLNNSHPNGPTIHLYNYLTESNYLVAL